MKPLKGILLSRTETISVTNKRPSNSWPVETLRSGTATDTSPDGEACSADVYGLHNPTGLELHDDLQADRRGSDANVPAV